MNAPRSPHPSAQTLGAFGLGKLDDDLSEAVGRHLEECDDCRNRVAELSADNFLKKVRRAEKPADVSNTGASLGDWSQTGAGLNPQQQGPPAADTLPPGFADNPDYEILRELGRGGMGVVYLAHNKLLGRDEVLKVMGKRIMERPGGLDRFLREIRAVAKFRHPNIVAAYSATRIGESLVFSMEYVEGLDLAKLVKAKGPLAVNHACNFIHQAALGLQHAHEEGLVHRDIKPANLILAKRGKKPVVKVLDFGLAKLTREEKVDGGLTSEGQALGTPDFIAPEQIRAAQSADIRADIYSLGGTLYYLLAGRPPFKATSLYDMYQAHISRDADPLNLIRPEVPSELAALVAKMLAKEPAERFQTPGEVAEALVPFFRKPRSGAVVKPVATEVPVPSQTPVIPPKPGDSSSSTRHAAEMSPISSAIEPSVPSGAEPLWASLIEVSAGEKEEPNLAPSSKNAGVPARPRWPITSAACICVFVLLLGIVIYIRRDKQGTTIALGKAEDLKAAGILDSAKSEVVKNSREAESTTTKTAETKDQEPPAELEIADGTANTPDPPGEADKEKTPNQTITLLSTSEATPAAESEQPVKLDIENKKESVAIPGNGEWVSLFNGKNLDGWKPSPNHRKDWRVSKGILVGSGSDAGVLYTERGDYRNFHLKVQMCYSEGGRGAVAFRSNTTTLEPRGLHATINSDRHFRAEPVGITGGIWDGQNVWSLWGNRKELQPAPGDWFTLEIVAVDHEFEVFVNGRLTGVFESQSIDGMGHLALQRLTPGATFEFRSIQIREVVPRKPDPHQTACLIGHGFWVQSVALSPDSWRVLTGGEGCMRHVWGWNSWEMNWREKDYSVRMWDASTGKLLETFPGHKPGTVSLVFSRDGSLAASGGGWREYQHLDVYEVATGRKIHELVPPAEEEYRARRITFSADNSQIRSTSWNGSIIHTWSLKEETELSITRLDVENTPRQALSAQLFLSDQNRFVTGNFTGAIETWSLKSGERLNSFNGHSAPVRALACSSDDKFLLSVADDNTARLWRLDKMKQLRVLNCGEEGAHSIALSPDGKRALTGGRYGSVCLWNLEQPGLIARFEGHTMLVSCLAFSDDGRYAVSGSHDKTARVWKLPPLDAPVSKKQKTPATQKADEITPTQETTEIDEIRAKGRAAILPVKPDEQESPDQSTELVTTNDPKPAIESKELRNPGVGGKPSARKKAVGWVQLFNGLDLTGWKTHESQPGNWRVENGFLVGRGPEKSHLYSQRGDYKNFLLRVEARINVNGNSGVYGRATYGPADRGQWPLGYEAAIDGDLKNSIATGGLYAGPGRTIQSQLGQEVPPGQWFKLELMIEGNRVTNLINDQITVDFLDDRPFSDRGHIALQVNQPGTVVEFRKIEIQELREIKKSMKSEKLSR